MSENTDRADLAIIVVSADNGPWLERCLATALEHAGDARVEAVVVDNGSTDGTREIVEAGFPDVRVLGAPNRGFAFGNNRGLEQTSARYVLLLNPDTEVVGGTFGELVAALDRKPLVGAAGVRQVAADGTPWPTIRRFPSPARALGEALGSERWPVHPAWAGERVLDARAYSGERECDWMSGSFLVLRREALASAGVLDERFFLYCEEPDLCLRVKRAGWSVVHLPAITVVHAAGRHGVRPGLVAQDAFARRQYAHKHFGSASRGAYLAALGIRHAIRAVAPGGAGAEGAARREGARRALAVLAGRAAPPFRVPGPTATAPVCRVPGPTAVSAGEGTA